MLEQMRKLTGNTIVLVLFGTIIFVFIFFFGPQTAGFAPIGRKWAGQVGDLVVYDTQVVAAFERRNAWSNVPDPGTDAEAAELRRTLLTDQLFVEWLAERAEDAGLAVSENEVRCFIVNWNAAYQYEGNAICAGYPASTRAELPNLEFALYSSDGTPDGRVDENYRSNILMRFQLSPDEFEARKGRELLARRYLQVLEQSLAVPSETIEATWRRQNDLVDLEYVRLDPTSAGVTEVSDDDVAAFLAAEPEAVETYYTENAAEFDIPRQVRLRRIYFNRVEESDPTYAEKRALYDSALARAQAGEDFEELARTLSENTFEAEQGGDMGLRTTENLSSALAEAAETMAVGDVRAVDSGNAWSVIKLEESIDAGRRELDEVRAEIARTILQNRAADSAEERILARARTIIELAQGGLTLAEAAAEEGGVPAAEGSGEAPADGSGDAAEGSGESEGSAAPVQAARPASAGPVLTAQTTGPFGRERSPVDLRQYGLDLPGGYMAPAPPPDDIPGMGRSREVAALAFALTTDAPVHPEPVKVEDNWYVIRLAERTPPPAEPTAADLSTVATALRGEAVQGLVGGATNTRLFQGLGMGDLPPLVQALYDEAIASGDLRINEEVFVVDAVEDLAAETNATP